MGVAIGDRCRIYFVFCRDWGGVDVVYYRFRIRFIKVVEVACGSVRLWRIVDGDLRRFVGVVLYVIWVALVGRGIDRYDVGVFFYGDCYVGDE